MNLIVDIGNTRVKVAVYQKDKMIAFDVFDLKDARKKILFFFEKFSEIRFSILSSVVKQVEEVEELLKERTTFFVLNHDLAVPFMNGYGSPETLGVDRIALAAAAFHSYKYQNALVVDAGTCITYDFITKEGVYKGGAISPGLQMRFRAMNSYTSKLPLIDVLDLTNFDPQIDFLGNSTQQSMVSGVCIGVLAEIESFIAKIKKEYKDLTVILTGGDSNFLSKRLKNSIFANSNFLLEGLNVILEHNKKE